MTIHLKQAGHSLYTRPVCSAMTVSLAHTHLHGNHTGQLHKPTRLDTTRLRFLYQIPQEADSRSLSWTPAHLLQCMETAWCLADCLQV